MAWEDRTPFDVIHSEFNITHDEQIKIVRSNLKKSSFQLWRKNYFIGPTSKVIIRKLNT